MLTRAAAELRAVNRGLRTLVEGICPAALTEQGLVAAVEALAERAPLPVAVAVPAQRWPQEAELALYYVVAEGLANIYRHAGASRAEIRITHSRGELILELSDDGRGGADLMAGTGLRGLQDRVGALGGTLLLDSPRDAGPGSPWSCRACDDRRRLRSAASVAR
ncbi:sensor histidine kinase [Streptomyces rimosus]|uniref:sensor histidine kinase n=1 Tax=Streptomyces rimosus TaxID=1927 RepID=UPI0037D5CEA7